MNNSKKLEANPKSLVKWRNWTVLPKCINKPKKMKLKLIQAPLLPKRTLKLNSRRHPQHRPPQRPKNRLRSRKLSPPTPSSSITMTTWATFSIWPMSLSFTATTTSVRSTAATTRLNQSILTLLHSFTSAFSSSPKAPSMTKSRASSPTPPRIYSITSAIPTQWPSTTCPTRPSTARSSRSPTPSTSRKRTARYSLNRSRKTSTPSALKSLLSRSKRLQSLRSNCQFSLHSQPSQSTNLNSRLSRLSRLNNYNNLPKLRKRKSSRMLKAMLRPLTREDAALTLLAAEDSHTATASTPKTRLTVKQ